MVSLLDKRFDILMGVCLVYPIPPPPARWGIMTIMLVDSWCVLYAFVLMGGSVSLFVCSGPRQQGLGTEELEQGVISVEPSPTGYGDWLNLEEAMIV